MKVIHHVCLGTNPAAAHTESSCGARLTWTTERVHTLNNAITVLEMTDPMLCIAICHIGKGFLGLGSISQGVITIVEIWLINNVDRSSVCCQFDVLLPGRNALLIPPSR